MQTDTKSFSKNKIYFNKTKRCHEITLTKNWKMNKGRHEEFESGNKEIQRNRNWLMGQENSRTNIMTKRKMQPTIPTNNIYTDRFCHLDACIYKTNFYDSQLKVPEHSSGCYHNLGWPWTNFWPSVDFGPQLASCPWFCSGPVNLHAQIHRPTAKPLKDIAYSSWSHEISFH